MQNSEAEESAGELGVDEAFSYAQTLHRAGDATRAGEIYRRILEIAPEHVDALHYLGVASHQLGQSASAVELIRRALALSPNYPDAHNNLGNVLRRQGHLDEARLAYERTLELRPDNPDALNNLGTILNARRQYGEAIALYRRLLELCPEHVEAHHNLGNSYLGAGAAEQALEAFRQALLLRPYDAASYRRLGAAFYALGRHAEAAEIYRRWLDVQPDDPEARHLVAATSGGAAPARASDEFIQRMFDRFAASFDHVLERLEYKAPVVVGEAVREAVGVPAADLNVLDAGCGTGLGGPWLRPYARRLVGMDLSEQMIRVAAERGVYDEFVVAELVRHMRRHPGEYDLVTAIDTLCYFGDLSDVAGGLACTLKAGGRAVFTLERAEEAAAPRGFRLNAHGRYSHAEEYVRAVLEAAGLVVVALRGTELRLEAGKPVSGFVVVAHR